MPTAGCAGVGVNHHTLGDFRVEHAQWLDGQLTRNVAAVLSQGLVSMNRAAHDDMRVRAHAGAASFRRRETLQELMQDAQAQVQALKLEVADDPGAGTRRGPSSFSPNFGALQNVNLRPA